EPGAPRRWNCRSAADDDAHDLARGADRARTAHALRHVGCRPVGRCADAAARSAGRRRGHAAGGRRQLSPRRPDPAAPGGPRRRRGAGAAMMIRITWMRGLLAVAVLATLGLGVAWSGIINIGA